MTTTISPTWTAEKAKQILDLVHEDIRYGLYATDEAAVTQLESFSDLHDFVDANQYLGDVMGWDALEEEYSEVSILVDALLSEAPIKL